MLGQKFKKSLKIQMDVTENIGSKNDDMMQQVTGKIGLLGGEEFLYIPYGANQITYVETELDCISSRFTGCVMAAFMWNGKRCVAHVAAPECNGKWNDLKQEITLLSEFNPSRVFDTKNITSLLRMRANNDNKLTNNMRDCFGIIDSENKKYAGFLASTRLGAQTDLYQHTVQSCVPVT